MVLRPFSLAYKEGHCGNWRLDNYKIDEAAVVCEQYKVCTIYKINLKEDNTFYYICWLCTNSSYAPDFSTYVLRASSDEHSKSMDT